MTPAALPFKDKTQKQIVWGDILEDVIKQEGYWI